MKGMQSLLVVLSFLEPQKIIEQVHALRTMLSPPAGNCDLGFRLEVFGVNVPAASLPLRNLICLALFVLLQCCCALLCPLSYLSLLSPHTNKLVGPSRGGCMARRLCNDLSHALFVLLQWFKDCGLGFLVLQLFRVWDFLSCCSG